VQASGNAFVCAHGGHKDDRGMIAVARALGGAGFDVVRFNFPYREKGSKRPDPMPILKDCIAQVVAQVRKQVNPRRLIIGGRSMGGRAASMLAAESFPCDGLLLLAYPLHPAGEAGEAARRASAADPRAGPVLQRNSRRPVSARADGAGAAKIVLAHALAGRRRSLVSRAQVVGKARQQRRHT